MAPHSRRRLLQATTSTASLALAGCLASFDTPTATHRYVSTAPTDPVVDGYDSHANSPPITTTVVTSARQADRSLDLDALPDSEVGHWRDVDYDDTTVTVLCSTRDLHEPENTKVVDVTTSFENATANYEIRVKRWPRPLVEDAEQYYYTRLAKWDQAVDGDDANATITIDYDRI